ncbi:hypothetical protein HPP05_09480 [Corallococcus exiguus]|uniref:hypothetical protein n=1 Tax=Corallococcus exiguus TaxID=83462 RepID=UPI0014940F38|nr:hypothetical protein [Corallococcus exiguus]NPC69973.1 hypothetical protein [Corallococcus exiguus]
MAAWAYKATNSKAGSGFTQFLANSHRFLARTAYYPPKRPDTKLVRAASAWNVAIGDTFHIYFGANEKRHLGAYTVMDPAKSGPGFAKAGTKGAFAEVRDTKLTDALTSMPGYKMDPFFECYVGYVLEPRRGVLVRQFKDVRWPGQHTLIQLP